MRLQRAPLGIVLFVAASSCAFRHKRVSDYGMLTIGEARLTPWKSVALAEGDAELARYLDELGERAPSEYPSAETMSCVEARVVALRDKGRLRETESSQRHFRVQDTMQSTRACSKKCALTGSSHPIDVEAAKRWSAQCEAEFRSGIALELEAPLDLLARAEASFAAGRLGEAVSTFGNAKGWLRNLQAEESKRQLGIKLAEVEQAHRLVFDRSKAIVSDARVHRLAQEAGRLTAQLAALRREKSASARILTDNLNAQLATVTAEQVSLLEALLHGAPTEGR